MAVRLDKETGDLVIDGFENGIANSPHKGLANIQNANISTETGEMISSFARVQDSFTSTATGTGSLTFIDSSHVGLSIANSNNLFKGQWITITNSSNTGQLPNGTYYVPASTGAGFQLQNYYNVSATTASAAGLVNILAVGGGGGGGGSAGNNFAGAGGGAGQLNYQTAQSITNLAAYTVTVGTGGAGGAAQTNGTVGVSSSITGTGVTITAVGGGYGAAGNGTAGGAGASGGGGVGTGIGGVGSAGSNGGAGSGATAGAGGGASAVGGAGAAGGAVGGAGTANSITGASVTYAGGGGSGASSGGGGAGGAGGGGAGGANGSPGTAGSAGTANTGGGGGGGGLSNSGSNVGGGAGGSGVVIISVPTGIVASATGGVKTTSGGRDIWTFTSSGTWTPTLATVAAPTNLLTGFTTGLTATIQLVATMGKPLASAVETYFASGVTYHRYYILDSNGLVWVYDDQNEVTYSSSDNVSWFLPDYNALTNASGVAVISGILVVTTNTGIFGKSVATLGGTNTQSTTFIVFPESNRWTGTSQATSITHFCYVGHQGTLYITDGSYIVSVFPDAALAAPGVSTAQNVQSFCSYTWPNGATEITISIISGTTPTPDDGKRVPAVFFSTGNLPPTLAAGTVYYIASLGDNVNYQVYAAATGGSALDTQTGAQGTQYFNTFYPLASASASTGGTPTYTFTNPAVALPVFEIAQCMAEIGTTIIIGCQGNTLYPWNQQATQASNIISLPESNVTNIITVHQMAYFQVGNKGNLYITDGSTASAVSTVPDYCAGVPGTPSTYIEPTFTWGGMGYVRGRVYFSIQDQTTTKTGNCGGIWSFVPTQQFYIGQDVGIALRQENQSSYGTYNGVATIIIPKVRQNVASPQYFSGWQSSVTTPAYGIDTTGTSVSTAPMIMESDAIPTGTMLDKKTDKQIEYKLASPLDVGATVQLYYRLNLTDAWTSLGTVESDNNLSGFFKANFQKTQWLQIQQIATPVASGNFIRSAEIRIR